MKLEPDTCPHDHIIIGHIYQGYIWSAYGNWNELVCLDCLDTVKLTPTHERRNEDEQRS